MPVSESDYRRHPEPYWKGRRVRLLAALTTNGGVTYPAGSTATITRKFGGFELRGDPCGCCGVILRLKQVNPALLDLLPAPDKP